MRRIGKGYNLTIFVSASSIAYFTIQWPKDVFKFDLLENLNNLC